MRWIFFALLGFLWPAGFVARADTVNLSNGDRFIGSVALVTEKEVHVRNDAVGLIKVPREKVASIFFGTNQPSQFGASADSSAKPSVTAIDPKAVEQVQKDFLATATPEANAMFTDMLQGLSSGKLSIDDLRKQATDSLKELRDLQSELGEETDNPLLSGYVGILEKFIRAGPTNRPPPAVKPAPRQIVPPDEE